MDHVHSPVKFRNDINGLRAWAVASVVYKKELLDMDFILNSNYKTLAPIQDDLWFKKLSFLAKTRGIVATDVNNYVFLLETAEALPSTNTVLDSLKLNLLVKSWKEFISKFKK